MNEKWFFIGLALMMIAMFGSIATMFGSIAMSDYAKSQKEIEFAKAGLQQCVQLGKIKDEITWKKECK